MPLTSIRAFAALWVVGAHFAGVYVKVMAPWLHSALVVSHMGVDIFFVLSGFILAAVYQDLTLATMPHFFVKRLARVYPLNIAITAIVAAFSACGMFAGVWVNWPALPSYFLMLEPFMPHPVPAWVLTSWSIPVELICYMCFPASIMLLRRLPRTGLIAAVLLCIAFEYWVQQSVSGHFWGWRAVVRGLGGFSLGVSLGSLALRLTRCQSYCASFGEIVSLIGIVTAVAAGNLGYVPIFSGALILFLYFDTGVVSRGLRWRPLFFLGEISFSIYLVHGVILSVLSRRFFLLGSSLPSDLALAVTIIGFLSVIVALSTISYRLFEQPGRRLGVMFRRLLPPLPRESASL